MPAAVRYVAPVETKRHPLLAVAQEERRKRKQSYETALEYYEGDYDRQLLVDEEGLEPDYNVGINMVKLTADRTVSFLYPQMPVFEIDPTSPEKTDEETWVENFFKANGGLSMMHKMAQRGFLSGHVFCRMRANERIYQGEVYPTLSVLDPTSVSVYWKADDVAEVMWYEQRYLVGGNAVIEDHIRSDDGLSWTTRKFVQHAVSQEEIMQQQTSHGTPADLSWQQIYYEQGGWTEEENDNNHPYWIPPIIEWSHLPHPNDYYGQLEFDHKDLLDTINRLWSEISRIVHIHSDPKDVVTGTSPDEVEDGGSILAIDNPAARVQRLTLGQGALSEALDTVQKLTETFLALSRVVLLKGEAKDLQRVTNASVRTLFLDAIAKNSLLQYNYGDGLSRIGELAIKMGKLPNKAKTLPITPKFAEPLPVDMTELANVAAIMNQMRAWSLRTIREKTGVEPSFEAANIEEESEAALEMTARETEAATPAEPKEDTPVDKNSK